MTVESATFSHMQTVGGAHRVSLYLFDASDQYVMPIVNRSLRVMHIISGDLWAGAEAQAFTLLSLLQKNVDLLVVLLNPGELADRLNQQKVRMIIMPESQLASHRIFFRLLGVMYHFKPDVVHTHRQKENILGGFAFLFNRVIGRAKVCVRTVHGMPESSPSGLKRLVELLNLWVGRHVQTAVIAVSEDLRNRLMGTFKAERLVLIKNGVDCKSSIDDDLALSLSPGKLSVGIVGRLEQVKRVDLFLQAASILLKIAPFVPWHFHVVGDGKLSDCLIEMARELGIAESVSFHGQVTAVASYLSSFDVVVMCSDHEGTPMVALEAISLGVPIIAHRVGGLVELLSPQPRALVDQHTPEAYAQHLLEFVKNPFEVCALPDEYTAEYNEGQVRLLYSNLIDRVPEL